MAGMRVRYRRLRLSPGTPAQAVPPVIGKLSRRPGVHGVWYHRGDHELLVHYDLAYLCMEYIERWVQDQGLDTYDSYYTGMVREAVHRSEQEERARVLGPLAGRLPCGSAEAAEALGKLDQADAAPFGKARGPARRAAYAGATETSIEYHI